ncbi:polysaccharide deacetylase family protein [Arthrobacter sp. UYEF36]|uniref:polysaccharide deacetylase family protein n=1 Tax=Arthrobacter sp. UYEF36 TaxID=1756366 RepID=UPI003390853A
MLRISTAAAIGAGAATVQAAAPAGAEPVRPTALVRSLAVSSPRSSPSGRGAVMLSMDDGYLAMDTVRRMLDDRGQRGTFFITPGLLNGPSKIDASHISAMTENGHEVGAHSQTHPNFTKITQSQRIAELETPKVYLQSITGLPVGSFAYPYGIDGRNSTTDLELYLRYERVFDTAQYNQTALQGRYSRAQTLIRRTCVDGSNHNQCLSMIREAAVRPVIASLFFHNIDTPINPSMTQLTEMLDLAQTLGVELCTASEAFSSHRMIANAGFESSSVDAYPWRWFKSGTGGLSITTEDPPPGLPGTRSLHLHTSDRSYSQVAQAIEVEPGTTYVLSFRARAVSGPAWGTNCAYGSVTALDYAQAPISGSQVRSGPIMATNTSWDKYRAEFTPSAACTRVLVGLTIDGPWGGGRVAFDHVWFGPSSMADLG